MSQGRPGGNRARARAVDGGARNLLERGDLLERLDGAVTKRVTVISAPAGSGKTSLLRAWAERRRVAFVSVERDEHSAERFWNAVLDAIREPDTPSARSALDGDELLARVTSEIAEQSEPLVLI